MKKLLLVVVLVVLPFINLAQSDLTDNIIWGKLEKTEKKKYPVLIGTTNQNIIYLRTPIQGFGLKLLNKTIEVYDKESLELVNSGELILEFNGNKLLLIDLVLIGDKPIVLTCFMNSTTNTNYYFYQELNLQDLSLNEPKVLMEYKYNSGKSEKLTKAEKKEHKKQMMQIMSVGHAEDKLREQVKVMSIYTSDNGAFSFLPYGDISSGIPYVNFDGKLMDTNFNEINSFKYTIPFNQYKIRETKVSNDGIAYLLVDKLLFKEKSRNDIFYDYVVESTHVLYIDLKSGESEIIKLELKDRHFSEVTLKTLKNGGVIIVGLTSKPGGNGADRVSSIVFDKDMNEVNSLSSLLEENFITSDWSDRMKSEFDKRNRKNIKKGLDVELPQLKNFVIKSVIELNDGSITVLAEQFVKTVTSGSRGGASAYGASTYGNATYSYNDIIAFNFNSNGGFEWVKRIEKQQVSSNDQGEYSSIFVIPTDEVIEIIYNEGWTPIKVQLRPDGTFKKESFIKFDEKRIVLLPKQCRELNNDEFLLYTIGKSGNKIGILKL